MNDQSKQFTVEFDGASGVATLRMRMDGRVNKVNPAFGEGFVAALDEALALDGLTGIIVASGHKDFCVGADLDFVYRTRDAAGFIEQVGELHAVLRRLETCGKPVVAALTGSALGGGFEIALACHHRVALADPRVQLGLPEVNLGVIPGGGGTQRLPRLVGVQPALEMLAQGQIVRPDKALAKGFIHATAPDADTLMQMARDWIGANPKATQPWDAPKFRYPGGHPHGAQGAQVFFGGAAMLTKKTAGVFDAPRAVMEVVYEGTLLDFESALQVEARAFTALVVGDQAKDMIRTFWYHKNAVDKQADLPQIEDARVGRIGILGAGMMGAGIAVVSARRGYDVVLRDIDQGALDRGVAHVEKEIGKLRHLDADAKGALRARITGTLEADALKGCDLIIEAVFENIDLKHRVIRETEALLGEDAIFASNTSALPITDLAQASIRPENFVGLHFFSPVEKMPLLEIIAGEQTSEETLARALNYAKAIKKTAIVVGDGYGFYTSRFFSAYIVEGAQLVAEGYPPVLVERAAQAQGMVVPPLKVFDEVTLSLAAHASEMAQRYVDTPENDGMRLVKEMVALGRTGKADGAGFYDYSAKPRRLWDGLAGLATGAVEIDDVHEAVEALGQRLMLVQALEAARCMENGVLRHARDAEIGAIFGVGFAPNTGGPLAWMDRMGIPNVVAALDALAEQHGDRYAPPPSLRAMAEKGETWFEPV